MRKSRSISSSRTSHEDSYKAPGITPSRISQNRVPQSSAASSIKSSARSLSAQAVSETSSDSSKSQDSQIHSQGSSYPYNRLNHSRTIKNTDISSKTPRSVEQAAPSRRPYDPHFVDGRKLPTEDNLLAQENLKAYSQLRRRPSSGESGSWKYQASRNSQGGTRQTVSPLLLKEKADSHSLGQSPSFHFSSLLSPKYRNRQFSSHQERDSAQKVIKKKLPRWLVIVIAVGTSVLILGLSILSAWVCLLSPIARISPSSLHIIDAHSQWVDTPSVDATAQKLLGQPLYFSHTREIETALRNVKGVDNVSITKKFPNQVDIKIIAFTPQAIVKDKAGILKVVARTGAILGTIPKPVEGLPIINIDDAVSDKTLTQAAILQGLQVLHQIPPVIHSTLVEMSAFNQDSVTTKSANGLTIIWGNASNMRLKVAVVEHIVVNKAIMKGKSVIDVSVPDKPIVK